MDINNKCWGHNCEKYGDALKLWDVIKNMAQAYNKERIVLTFKHLLFRLDIDETTPLHWNTCKPNNLKVLAKARILCDETIYHAISKEPKLLFEYWKLTRQGGIDESKKEDSLLDIDTFRTTKKLTSEDEEKGDN